MQESKIMKTVLYYTQFRRITGTLACSVVTDSKADTESAVFLGCIRHHT